MMGIKCACGLNNRGGWSIRGDWPMLVVDRLGLYASQSEIERSPKVDGIDTDRPVHLVVVCVKSRPAGDWLASVAIRMGRLRRTGWPRGSSSGPDHNPRPGPSWWCSSNGLPDLELNDEDNVVDQEYGVDAPAHGGMLELHEQRTGEDR